MCFYSQVASLNVRRIHKLLKHLWLLPHNGDDLVDVGQHLTRLEQQRQINQHEILSGQTVSCDFAVHLMVDLRMRHRIEELSFLHIAEDDFSQHFTIYRFIIVENFLAELGLDLFPSRFARFDDCHHIMITQIYVINKIYDS